MRLSIALAALAGGLGLGWAALAQADAPPPPAAPIFYCPAAPGAQKGAPAPAAKSCPAPAPAHVARVEHRREEFRHEPRYAEGRWVAHEEAPRMVRQAPRNEDVSASQAMIYRYEHAVHGFNAEAADRAWAPDDAPPPPNMRDDRRIIREREFAEAARPVPPVVAPLPPPGPPEHVYVQPAPPPPVVVEVAPTPPARVYVERMAPPPAYERPCPDHCPMSYDHHDGWRDHRDYADAPPPPPAYVHHEEHYGFVTPQAPPAAVYERHEEHYGYLNQPPAHADHEERERIDQGRAYAYERRETEQSSGWRYSDGDGHYAEHEHYDDRRGPCPPSPDHGCSAASDGSYGAVYQYSGRDSYGFLVWPGKADGQ